MYNINSLVDEPNLDYLKEVVEESMEEGIAMHDIKTMNTEFLKYQKAYGYTLSMEYGIANPNSYKQVMAFLQSIQDDEITAACYNEETEKWTTDKDAMHTLALLGYEFAKVMLFYRKAKSFAQATDQYLNAQFYGDKRVHPSVTTAKTNRIQYAEPALLNIPKELLWSMVKPRVDGNYLISADIKNQEPSIMINMLNIESLKPAIASPNGLYETLFSYVYAPRAKANLYIMQHGGERIVDLPELTKYKDVKDEVYSDICEGNSIQMYVNGTLLKSIPTYNLICSKDKNVELPSHIEAYTIHGEKLMLEVRWDKVSKATYNKGGLYTVYGELPEVELDCTGIVRDEFKRGWNSLTYGVSKMGLKMQCKHIDGNALYNYFYDIPEFMEYRLDCGRRAKAGKQDVDTYFGSKLYANEVYTSALKRILMDIPVQGTGADILALLVEHFNDEAKERGINELIWMYFPRHDEIVFEADKDWVESIGIEAVYDILRDIMVHQVDDWEPFNVKIGVLTPRTLAEMLADLDID